MSEEILILNQLSQMSAALFAGVFGGIAYDAYSAWIHRGTRRRKHPLAYLKTDALFAVGLTAILLLFWFNATDGSLRYLVFIWFGLGTFLYFAVFKKQLINRIDWDKIRNWRLFSKVSLKKHEHHWQEKTIDHSAHFFAQVLQEIQEKDQKAKAKIRERIFRKEKKE